MPNIARSRRIQKVWKERLASSKEEKGLEGTHDVEGYHVASQPCMVLDFTG